MKPEIAKIWSNALRSGRFEQTTGALASNDRNKHCCLGVLCELAAESGVNVEIAQSAINTTYNYESMNLPPVVVKWAGMHTTVGFLDGDSLDGPSLIAMNDSGIEFEKIADVIDDNWETI